MHSLPADFATTKRHTVRFGTSFQPGHAKYVHHWVMYECDPAFESSYLRNASVPKAGTCAGGAGETQEWKIVQRWCSTASLGNTILLVDIFFKLYIQIFFNNQIKHSLGNWWRLGKLIYLTKVRPR
jgi:hypothetical protein